MALATDMLGRWAVWNATDEPVPYGLSPTYEFGAAWLEPCALVEDWGCGRGWLSTLVAPDRYRGVDGSASPFAAVVADLTEYRSQAPGVFMRHVLEHNESWSEILANAAASARERLFIALFTPTGRTTRQIAWNDNPGVPDISFRLRDLTDPLRAVGFTVTTERIASPATQYEVETMIRAAR